MYYTLHCVLSISNINFNFADFHTHLTVQETGLSEISNFYYCTLTYWQMRIFLLFDRWKTVNIIPSDEWVSWYCKLPCVSPPLYEPAYFLTDIVYPYLGPPNRKVWLIRRRLLMLMEQSICRTTLLRQQPSVLFLYLSWFNLTVSTYRGLEVIYVSQNPL